MPPTSKIFGVYRRIADAAGYTCVYMPWSHDIEFCNLLNVVSELEVVASFIHEKDF